MDIHVTAEEVHAIYDPVSSKYHGVVQWQDNRYPRFCAKVLAHCGDYTYLGTYDGEKEAATEVVRFFKRLYGYRWLEVLKGRWEQHWKVKKLNRVYKGIIWLCGTRIVVCRCKSREEATIATIAYMNKFRGIRDELGRPALLAIHSWNF